MLFPSTVSAATPGDTDLIRERQDRLLEEQSRRLEDLKNLPGQSGNPVTPSASNDERCFPISSIDLEGADSLSSAERQRLLTPFTGQCLGVAQLDLLLKTITDHYLGKGLVTSRAYLPQQDLSSGALQVLVVEGRLERVRSAEDSGLSERELAMSFPGKPGDLLNLREIEQMVDQLNRLPSNNAKMELAPGERIGGSEVLVRNTRQKPWRVGLSRHNDGQASTGEQQWGASFDWDSPLGLSDQLLLRGGHDAVSDRQKTSNNAMLRYSVPFGWWNLSYTYSQSEYRSQIQALGFDFKQSGESQNHQLYLERVIFRDAVSKTSVSTGLAHLRTNNFIEDSKLRNSSNRITITKVLDETPTKNSPSARLVAGKGLTVDAQHIENRYSLMAANGDMTLVADSLLNQGAVSRSGIQIIQRGTPGRIATGYWDQMEFVDVPAFNAAVAGGHFDEAGFNELISRSTRATWARYSRT